MRQCLSGLFATFALLGATMANAALVESDWQTPGDSLMVTDTAAGLDWLDITVTEGQSYNQVSTQLGAGGTYAGLRYATVNEVRGLIAAIGINLAAADDNSDPDEYFIQRPTTSHIDYVTARNQLQAFFNIFGRTNVIPGCGSVFITECGEVNGMTGDANGTTSTSDRIFSRLRYFDNSGGAFIEVDPTYASLSDSGGGTFGPITGSFLVRTTVPLPPAVFFLGGGIAALLLRTRRA